MDIVFTADVVNRGCLAYLPLGRHPKLRHDGEQIFMNDGLTCQRLASSVRRCSYSVLLPTLPFPTKQIDSQPIRYHHPAFKHTTHTHLPKSTSSMICEANSGHGHPAPQDATQTPRIVTDSHTQITYNVNTKFRTNIPSAPPFLFLPRSQS
ncbi:hypothetical protein CONLIGDRAFT_150234 [Coniochaeta ligniaria NRRL 30616]|uniref:Uncharacterized protein n=1 Tax=Coniochaeta ligniaria NRRL 30616 TaxID=1408157 RepID=A0A1J7I5S2_9PEZI|nr:hypothetical protein CONLIGDRAFT_150234 [Coniochaeta ligniaria NRRL 30616]